MFNYVLIDFPTVTAVVPPERLLSFTLHSENFAHEVAYLTFRDWDIPYEAVQPGTPVSILIRSPEGSRRFYSYIHYINPVITPGRKTTELMLVGASYKLKQASQRIFKNIKAHEVIKQIAKSHGFAADVEPHPRVWDQIAQAGHTDLELMTRLAKHSGYNLRIIGTTVEFKPHNFDYGTLRPKAPVFTMRDPNNPQGSTLYSFNMVLGDALDYGSHMKSAISVSGIEPLTAQAVTSIQNVRQQPLRQNSNTEIFDRFATKTVAPGFAPAYYEALAEEAKNRYPYRALIEVSGHPEVYPAEPIFLEGIGRQYSGYWIPLSVEHQIFEESTNNFRYTTVMEVGTDSLGTAAPWSDGTVTAFSNPKAKIKRAPHTKKKQSKNRTVLKT
jgi:hypothetical protein